MLDLSDYQTRLQLAETIECDINDACVELYDSGHRKHLGASSIGDRCARKLWYQFRWVKKGFFYAEDDHPGRMLRLWERGKLQELTVEQWLKKAGYKVETIDPETMAQFRFEDINDHFGGSCDGNVWLPDKYEYPEPLLLEIKTCKDGANFNNYAKEGVKLHNEQYWGRYIQKHELATFNSRCEKLYRLDYRCIR